jgi:hypothetical protein
VSVGLSGPDFSLISRTWRTLDRRIVAVQSNVMAVAVRIGRCKETKKTSEIAESFLERIQKMSAKKDQRRWGHIRKLDSGRFQASFVGPDLRRYNGPVTFDSKMLAEGWLAREVS